MSEKLAWPYDLDDVVRDLEARIAAAPDSATRDRLARTLSNVGWGRALTRGATTGAQVFGRGTASIGRGLGTVLGAASPVGRAALSGLGAFGSSVLRSPRALGTLAAGAALAPALTDTAEERYDRVTNNILAAHQDPRRMVEERTVTASLDSFLEKKAATPPPLGMGSILRDSAIKGLATGAGSGIAQLLLSGAGRLVSGAHDSLFGDPQKKQILEKILTTDQIIADAIKRNPATKSQILEAYGTLNKFAPTLATDVNAVRSFLREVVLGGGHVNYATIKNLVDTEKAIHGDSGKSKGIF